MNNIFGVTQILYGILYTMAMLLISIALGLACVKRNIFGKKNNIGKFCMGASLTPIIIPIWMILFSFLPNGEYKKSFIIFIPLILAAVAVIKNFRILVCGAEYFYKALLHNKILLTTVVIVLGILICKIWYLTLGQQTIGSDAAFYMAEALKFSRSLSYRDIATHKDFIDGSLAGSVHNFMWPAYLSYAHLFSDRIQSLGHDLAALLSMKYTFLYLVITIFGITHLIFEKVSYSLMSVLLFLLSPYRDYLIVSSRSFYRLIPVVLTLGLLYIIIQNVDKLGKDEFFILFLTGLFTISGHAINFFFIAPIGIIGLIFMLVNRIQRKTIGLSVIVYIGGLIVGAYNIIFAYFDTGDLAGKCSLYSENIYKGTELENIYLNIISNTMVRDESIALLLEQIFNMDKYRLVTIGIFLSVLVIVLCIIKKTYTNKLFFLLSYITCFLMIIVGKYVTWGSFTFPEWLSRNGHYAYHYYILAIMCILSGYDVYVDFGRIKKGRELVKKKNCANAIVIAVLTLIMSISLKLHQRIEYEQANFKLTYYPLIEAQNTLDFGKVILVSASPYSYQLNLEARILSSYFGVPIYNAKDEKELLAYLKQENIEYIYLNMSSVNKLYQYARFYSFINDMDSIELVNKNENMELYKVLYDYTD